MGEICARYEQKQMIYKKSQANLQWGSDASAIAKRAL